MNTLSHLQLSLYYASIQKQNYPVQIGCVLDLSRVQYDEGVIKRYLCDIAYLNQGIQIKNQIPHFIPSHEDLNIEPIPISKKDAFTRSPFSYDGSLLYRVGYDPDTQKLLFVVHHILLDGISIQYLMIQLYRRLQGLTVDYCLTDASPVQLNDAHLKTFIEEIEATEPTYLKPLLPKGEIVLAKRVEVPIAFRTKHHLPVLIEAAIAMYLGYLNQQETVRYGVVFSQRNTANKTALGMYSQAYPIHVKVSENLTIASLFSHIKLNHLKVLRRRFIPFEPLLNISRKYHQTAVLFDVTVIDQTLSIDNETPIEPLFYPYTDQSLVINIWNRESPKIYMDYATNAYSDMQIQCFTSTLLRLVKTLDAATHLSDVKVVENFPIKPNLVSTPHLLDIYDEGLKTHFNSIAIVDQQCVTYQQLELESNQLSHYLSQLNQNLIILEGTKSYPAVLGMLAAIKAGKPFVFRTQETAPYLDAALDLSKAKWAAYPTTRIPKRESDILAYYFTSGTTGRKQIAIEAKGLSHHLTYASYIQEAADLKAIPLISKLHFDLSLEEIWIALKYKLKLVMLDDLTFMDPQQRKLRLSEHPVDGITTTPTILNMLYDQNKQVFSHLKWVVSGGSSLSSNLAYTLLQYPNLKLFNSYGPTETTIAVTSIEVKKDQVVSIGIPHPGIDIIIHNKAPLPLGEVGEIYVSGPTISPSVETTLMNGIAYYGTGDYGYQDSDHKIYFIGRRDRQIKRHDHRIDLNWIDQTLQNHPSILLAHSEFSQDQIITTYQTTQPLPLENLWSFIKETLPKSHFPNQLIHTESMTPEGKITKGIFKPKSVFKPKLYTESLFVRIIQKLLSVDRIHLEDTWTDLGGDSLSAIQTLSILDQYQVYINPESLFNESIQSMIQTLKKQSSDYSKISILKTVYPITKTKSICLYGANGFLGVHLLETFIVSSNAKIICPLRVTLEKLQSVYQYYTDSKLDVNRVVVVPFTEPLSNTSIDLIINGAGYTQYTGSKNDFESINVDFVLRLGEYATLNKIPLIHISTIGIGLFESNFKEQTAKIRRSFLNPYLESKAKAEVGLFNLQSPWIRIIRVGNLTPSSRLFKPERSKNNAFIRSLGQIEPDFSLSLGFDITPVDVASKAIWHSLNLNQPVLHILNPQNIGLQSGELNPLKSKYPIHSKLSQLLLRHQGFQYPVLSKSYLAQIVSLAQKK